MHIARHADSTQSIWTELSTQSFRPTKLLGAAMAITGASVIAIHPVTPTLPVIQERTVELSGWIDPIGVIGDSLTTTVQNLGRRGAGILAEGLPAAWQIITDSSLYSEIASAVFNPMPGLERFFGNLSTYAATINTGLKESSSGYAEHFGELPEALQTAWEYVLQGQFTRAFATVTSWSIFGLGEIGWPLEPVFKIPGEIARDFGLNAVGAVLDTVLVANNATTGYAYSLLSPPITAIYQLTDIMNVVSASIYDGDWVTAISEVVNAPVKVLNAFLNGYQPSVAGEWEFFPGLFSKDGPIDAFFVQLPKAIAAALADLSERDDARTATAPDELAEVSTAALSGEDRLVTLPISTGTDVENSDEATEPTGPAGGTATVGEEVDEDTTVSEPADDVAGEDTAEQPDADDMSGEAEEGDEPAGESDETAGDDAADSGDPENGDSESDSPATDESDPDTSDSGNGSGNESGSANESGDS